VDYDRDGYLDLIVTRYLDWDFSKNIFCGDQRMRSRSYCHPDEFPPTTHLVFHNNDSLALILLNRGGNGNHWLLMNTVRKRSNRDGIGARIRVVAVRLGAARLREYRGQLCLRQR
jgi:hypothetical protein